MTFTKSPFGPIAKVTPTDVQQPNTPSQRAANGRFSLVASHWRALTVSQRLEWSSAAVDSRREAADAKKSYRSSGYALYSSLSNLWLQAHNDQGTPPVAPPSDEWAGPALTITAAASSGSVVFHGSASTSAGTTIQFEVQRLASGSRKPSKTGYRVAGFSGLDAGDGNEASFAVRPGAYCARYAFVNAATGQRTGFVEIAVTGVALALEQGGADAKPASARKKAA